MVTGGHGEEDWFVERDPNECICTSNQAAAEGKPLSIISKQQ